MLIPHSPRDLTGKMTILIQIKIPSKYMQHIGSIGQCFEPVQLRSGFANGIGSQQVLCLINKDHFHTQERQGIFNSIAHLEPFNRIAALFPSVDVERYILRPIPYGWMVLKLVENLLVVIQTSRRPHIFWRSLHENAWNDCRVGFGGTDHLPAMTHVLAEAEHTLRGHNFSMAQLSRDEGQTALSDGEWLQVQQSYLLAFLHSLCYTREK